MKRFATSLLMLSLTACADRAVIVTSVDTFCTRVERHHATEAERAALKRAAAIEPETHRFIKWGGAINKQWDEHCLKPVPGA